MKRPNVGKPTSSVVKNVSCQSFAKSLGFKQDDKHISKPVIFQNKFEIPHVGIPKRFSTGGATKEDYHNTWYVDSGCSRHMTGNIRLLEDVINIDGGYVAFAGNKGGYITG
ncbi:hypothetical protein L1987_63919 [Smallanthus sonchifolius]|uniref:Uncharacterized protein n=1 Tax=Smallanthus sonchifolius TaxID=185202 RepID=A0ACB9CEL7_9ASTR|nr:hypothetical protein L1987_63919 [Smallanthus sonchifolius]